MDKKQKKAIFLGKFQPPHLGHIRTILRIFKKYENLIIGITEDERILSTYDVKAIFDEIFSFFPSIQVEIISGIVEKGTAVLPKGVDVVLSGNQKVLDNLSSGYNIEFIPRTQGIGYSGTELRDSSFRTKAISLKKLNSKLKMELVEINRLKPLEQILPSHLKNIQIMIERDGVIEQPLIVDRKNNIILDGSHRYAYLLKEGFTYAPVLFVDYDDESIFVGNHLKHRFFKDERFTISKAEVIDRAINENIYSPRTTRHFFPFRKNKFPIELEKLKKDKERNIDFLIAQISKIDEIKIDNQYINEIDEEIAIIKTYLKEQQETKKYLKKQIEMMKQDEE